MGSIAVQSVNGEESCAKLQPVMSAADVLVDVLAGKSGSALAEDFIVPGPPHFCMACGTILLLPSHGMVSCYNCPFTCRFEQLENTGTVLCGSSRPSQARQAALRAAGGQKPKRATVQEPCPYCNHPEVEYYTMQMRSADEGETVFYECPECGHKWNQNN